METTLRPDQAAEVKTTVEKIIENVNKVVVGKTEIIELAVTALLCEGNVLMEDVPGIGKTLLASSSPDTGLRISTHSMHTRSATLRCDRYPVFQSKERAF
jgi:hypothetical protein